MRLVQFGSLRILFWLIYWLKERRKKKVTSSRTTPQPYTTYSKVHTKLDNKTDTSEKDNYHIKDCLFIKHGANFHKIKTEDILYIESDNIYINVHTRGIKYLVRQSIQNYLDLIGARHFMRVHKSYAINTSHIDQINTESVFINGKEIPIGKTYREDLLSFLRLC